MPADTESAVMEEIAVLACQWLLGVAVEELANDGRCTCVP
jgi:hypothetical protein